MKIGPYEILGELGRGGMGVVYRARDAALGRDVALKVLPTSAPKDVRERFLREGRIAARLRHPSIVSVHSAGEADGHAYLVQDLIDGESLAALIAREGPTPVDAARIIEQVARALAAAHAQGVIHRDVKPGNILLDRAGGAHLADFGLARDVAGTDRLSQSGQVLGTPQYMAPEQAEGRLGRVDARADLWGCGVVLYECLAGGGLPFNQETPVHVLAAVVTRDPIPLRRQAPETPRDLDTIVAQCLEKDPARRYQTAEALADDLARFQRGEPVHARPVGAASRLWRAARRRRTALLGILGTAVLAAAGVAVALLPRLQAEARARSAAEAARHTAERAQSAQQLAVTRRAAARPALDRAHAALARLDRLLGRPDWTPAQARTICAEVEAAATAALAADPASAEAHLASARMREALGEDDAALAASDRALAAEPDFAPALLGRALLRLAGYADRRGDRVAEGELEETPALRRAREGAAADLARARTLLGEVEELRFAEGLLAYAEGRWTAAGTALEAYARARVTDARAWRWAGIAWLEAENPARADAALTECLGDRPRDLRALCLRGRARRERRDVAGALADLDAAVALAPDDAHGYFERARVRRASKDLAGALADWDVVLSRDPRDAAAWNNRGNVRDDMGDLAGAVADFDRALALEPADVLALRNRAEAKRKMGDVDGAHADCAAALALEPRNPRLLAMRGRIRRAQGDPAGAVADYDTALAIRPQSATTHYNRALALEDLGEVGAALAAYTEALRVNPRYDSAYLNRGLVQLESGDAAAACADFDALLALEPRSYKGYRGRARARLRLQDAAGAAADAAQCLAHAPADWSLRRDVEALRTEALAAAAQPR